VFIDMNVRWAAYSTSTSCLDLGGQAAITYICACLHRALTTHVREPGHCRRYFAISSFRLQSSVDGMLRHRLFHNTMFKRRHRHKGSPALWKPLLCTCCRFGVPG
jgi:hypothetical protein